MESLIPIVNQLQEVISLAGVNLGIDLPRIIVVGSQSSGKSSVLESIVGRDFLPRGTGIVTRCPLELRLIKIESGPDYGTFAHRSDIFTEFSEITAEIITISDKIAASEGVSTHEIFLNIYSEKVVDLTLIDLPGIIKVPLKGQKSNLDQKINAMILEYARQENSIILAISPANSDLANSDALNVARQVDPEGKRTIGVITKIDLMDKGTNAVEMIEGSLFPLKLGYVGIVCRSQQDIINSVPLSEHLIKEKAFFDSKKEYLAYTSRLGIPYLAQRLSQVFRAHIQHTIPKIKREIGLKLELVTKEISEMGDFLDTDEKRNDMLYKIVSAFCKKFEDCLNGNDLESQFIELSGGSMILNIFKHFFANIRDRHDPLKNLTDYQIRIAIMNATGAKGVMFVSEIAFENLVKDIIKYLKAPSLECMAAVKDELQKVLNNIEIHGLERFGQLRELMINLGHEVIESFIPQTQKNLEEIIEIESSFLNISHPDFINPSEAMKIAQITLDESAKKPKNEVKQPEPKQEGYLFSWWGSKNEEEKKFEEIGDSELEFKQILDEEMSRKELEQNILIKILINSYFEIAKFNIGDSVPKAIMRNLVKNSRENIQRVLTSRLYNNKEVLEKYLDEDPGMKAKRHECISKRNSLTMALDIVKDVIA